MSCNSNFNTEPIINTIKETLENELNKLLINYVERHNLLENTHKGIMSLPSVKKELNQSIHDSEKSININNDNNNNIPLDLGEIKTIVYDLVKSEFKKHEVIIEKNNDTDKNNNNEIKQWTNTIIDLQKEIFELKEFIKSSIIIQEKQSIKLEKEEKENIKLEIKEVELELEEEEDESEEKDEELEEEEVEKEELQEAEEEKEQELESEEEDQEVEKEELEEAEVETEEEEEDSDEDEEYIEIEIDDIAYCTNDEENGFIYEIDKEGQPSKKVGYLKDGEAIFYE